EALRVVERPDRHLLQPGFRRLPLLDGRPALHLRARLLHRGEEILPEDEAERPQNQDSSQSQLHAAAGESAAAFHVGAVVAFAAELHGLKMLPAAPLSMVVARSHSRVIDSASSLLASSSASASDLARFTSSAVGGESPSCSTTSRNSRTPSSAFSPCSGEQAISAVACRRRTMSARAP